MAGAGSGKTLKIYKFEKIKRAKREVLAANPGAEIIDLGVGEPDEMAFPGAAKRLSQEAAKPENRGYADNGIQQYKDAAAAYLKKVYGVKKQNLYTQVLHSIGGSKPALAMLPYALINPGEIALAPCPDIPYWPRIRNTPEASHTTCRWMKQTVSYRGWKRFPRR